MECIVTEPWMLDILDGLLKRTEGAFIDVGVNVGQTLVKMKSLSIDRQYIGFEPNPACLYYVGELIKQNKFTACTIMPVGLYNQDQVLCLNLYSDDSVDSSASMIKGFRSGNQIRNKIYVPAFRFESIAGLVDFDGIAIVKIDVEGAELEVIQSLLDLIRDCRPIVLIEILPVYTAENLSRLDRQQSIESIFHSLDYIFHRVEKNRGALSSLTKIDEIGIHSDLSQCDYLLAPREFEVRL
jgi:FkbM family methyltransferase